MEASKQWYCDNCGKIIESSDDGEVSWNMKMHHSPNAIYISHYDCMKNSPGSNLSISSFLGDNGDNVINPTSMSPPNFHDEAGGLSIVYQDFYNRIRIYGYEVVRHKFCQENCIGHPISGENFSKQDLENILAEYTD